MGSVKLQLPKDPKPGQVVVNPIDGSELVFVPGGEFMMGSDPREMDRLWAKMGWLSFKKAVRVRYVHRQAEP